MKFVFDHIAVVARTLEEGADYVRDHLGIDMPKGGAHPKMGTHNLLMALSETEFLEVIAVNPNADLQGASEARSWPRWFGLDKFDSSPKLSTWILGASDIDKALACAPEHFADPMQITRGDLSWMFSVTEDGNLPMDGAFPTFIEWPEGNHPAGRMTNLGCTLEHLEISHPDMDEIEAVIGRYLDDARIEFTCGNVGLKAHIRTPNGLKILD